MEKRTEYFIMRHIYLINNLHSLAAQYGIGTYIKQIIGFLKSTEMKVTIVNLSSEQKVPEVVTTDGTESFNLPFPAYVMGEKNLLRYYQSVVDFLSLYADCHCKNIFHFNYLSHFPLLDVIKNRFPQSRTIVTVHYLNWLFSLKGNTKQFLQIIKKSEAERNEEERMIMKEYNQDNAFFNDVDHIICLANYTRLLLREHYGIADEKLHLIKNGMSLCNIKFLNEAEREEKRNQLHIASKDKLILFVGRLDALKGIEYLVEAFRKVLASIPDCRLWIVGGGDYSLGLNKADGIWNRITMTGKIPQDSLFALYQIADVGVLPSLCEQCSYVAIEMMAFDLPFIGTSTSGLKEMMPSDNRYTIELIETDDDVKFPIEQLSDKLIDILSEEKRPIAPIKKQEYFSTEGARTEMLNLYTY